MHVSLSSIGGTREEQLCILSAVLLWGVVAWLFTVRAARKTNNNIATNDNNLEAPLLDDEPKHAIRSRVRLASRQAAYYVLAIYYAICFLVYSVRLLRSRGEQRARLYRAGADLLRAVAWLVAELVGDVTIADRVVGRGFVCVARERVSEVVTDAALVELLIGPA